MYFEDIDNNLNITTPPTVIKRENILVFANELDPLKIHNDPEYAKNTRFGDIIAPGVLSFMSVWAKFVETGFFGDELIAGTMASIEWFNPVFPEDILTGKVCLRDKVQRNKYNGEIELKIDVYNQKETLVLSNITKAVVKCRCEE